MKITQESQSEQKLKAERGEGWQKWKKNNVEKICITLGGSSDFDEGWGDVLNQQDDYATIERERERGGVREREAELARVEQKTEMKLI